MLLLVSLIVIMVLIKLLPVFGISSGKTVEIFTLAGAVNPETGWGLAGETWQAMASLRAYDESRAWFNLGDLDLGTHLFRTGRLREGASLSAITADITRRWGIDVRLLPMTDDEVA